MEYGKGNVARLRSIEKSDVAQRGQCRRHQTGADVDYGDGGGCCIQRVENLHLIRSRRHINDFGNVRVKALQRTARRFGIEGAGGYVVCVKIIKQGPRNGGLADPALIRAYDNHYWLRHISYSSKLPIKWAIVTSEGLVWARQWQKQGEFMHTLRLPALNRHVQRVFIWLRQLRRGWEISALIRRPPGFGGIHDII